MKTLYFSEQEGYTRPPSLSIRIVQGLCEAFTIIIIVCWAAAVAIWDTVFAGKSADEQMGEDK